MAPWVSPVEASCALLSDQVWWQPLSGAHLGSYPLGLWHPVEGDVAWAKKLDYATRQYRGCRASGTGQYWALQILTMEEGGVGALAASRERVDACVRSMGGEAFETAWGSEAKCEGFTHMAFGVCAPLSCSKASVQGFFWRALWITPELRSILELLPEARARVLMRNVSLERVPSHSLVQAHIVREWAEFNLDWVVLGFPGSGTSALMANLHAHPAIEVLARDWKYVEDGAFFSLTAMHRFQLPTTYRVDRFNRWHTKEAAFERRRPRLRGVKYADYIYSDAALARLTQIPGIKGVVLMNDPRKRMEDSYLINWQRCQQSNSSYPPLGVCLDRNDGGCQRRCDGDDSVETTELRRWPALSNTYFRMMLVQVTLAVEAFTPERLFLAPSACFKRGRSCHDRLASFLGAGPFPENFTVRKWNLHNHGNKKRIRKALLESSDEVRVSHLAALRRLREQQAPEREMLRDMVRRLPHAEESEWPADLLRK